MNTSLTRLNSFYSDLKAPLLLQTLIRREFPGNIAVLTAFGAEAGLLLALVAAVDPAIPVLFLNSGRHFKETLDYAKELTERLHLKDVRHVTPDKAASDPEHCCALGRTGPLEETLMAMGVLALITGRRFEETAGSHLARFELDENGVFRINPLAGLTKEAHNSDMVKYGISQHPLSQNGRAFIGCEACAGKAAASAAREADLAVPTPAATSDWSV